MYKKPDRFFFFEVCYQTNSHKKDACRGVAVGARDFIRTIVGSIFTWGINLKIIYFLALATR